MTLCKYAKQKGFTLEQYKTLQNNIKAITEAIIQTIPDSKKNNGMYYPINELLPYNTNAELLPYYIQELKNQGIEFYDNNTLWRC